MTATTPTPDELREIPLLSTLSDQTLTVLVDYFTTADFRSGQSIVREGDVGYTFFVIRSGHVDVTQGTETLRMLNPGDFFGEIAIKSSDGKRSATVTARDDVEVWTMLGHGLRRLEVEHPDVAKALQQAAAERKSTE